MFNIKHHKWISMLVTMLACLFLATWLVIPAAAQNSCCSPASTNTCTCDCDADCNDACDCDCSDCDEEEPATANTRVRVTGFSQLYQVMVNGAAQTPPVFEWGVGNTVLPVVYHDGDFYLTLMNSGLFLAIEAHSPMDHFDFEQGFIWYGPDGIFGTEDDEIFSVDEILEDILDDMDDTSIAAWNAISVIIPGWPSIEGASESTNDNDNDNDNDDKAVLPGLPQTGFDVPAGAVIAALILSAGAGYLGIAYAKKIKDDKAEA
ncbi:MAG: hypothetical protein FWE40_08415 [Oscillospiraceae bacterium]|nr:hypothetical protein [Oscillospiraceae bacterium]